MAYKQRSPNKFIGKALRRARKGVMGGAAKLIGGGLFGGATSNVGRSVANVVPGLNSGQGPLAGIGSMGMLAAGPFMRKKRIGYKPYETPSPMKTDVMLVRGAYDAASGKGARKYGQIAKARAFADMVDSVERTTNRSSRVQLMKARRRSKRTVRSNDRFANWRERYERRQQRKERFKDRFRGKKRKAIDFDRYKDQTSQQPTGQRFTDTGIGY